MPKCKPTIQEKVCLRLLLLLISCSSSFLNWIVTLSLPIKFRKSSWIELLQWDSHRHTQCRSKNGFLTAFILDGPTVPYNAPVVQYIHSLYLISLYDTIDSNIDTWQSLEILEIPTVTSYALTTMASDKWQSILSLGIKNVVLTSDDRQWVPATGVQSMEMRVVVLSIDNWQWMFKW